MQKHPLPVPQTFLPCPVPMFWITSLKRLCVCVCLCVCLVLGLEPRIRRLHTYTVTEQHFYTLKTPCKDDWQLMAAVGWRVRVFQGCGS